MHTGPRAEFLAFSRDRRPETALPSANWDRFIREQQTGGVPSAGPFGPDGPDNLKFLLTVLNWAARSRDEKGRLLLQANPLRGLQAPKQKNPARVVLTEDEYRALLDVSRLVGWRFRVALVLAHETGHRIGAIRKLRWPDIDFEDRTIRWRAENEKTGYEHHTPVTAEAVAVLEEARERNPRPKGVLVLPSPQDSSRCVGAALVRSWWCRAERLAGFEPKRGRGLALPEREVRQRPHGTCRSRCSASLAAGRRSQTILKCYHQGPDAGTNSGTALGRRRSTSST